MTNDRERRESLQKAVNWGHHLVSLYKTYAEAGALAERLTERKRNFAMPSKKERMIFNENSINDRRQ